MSTPKIVIYMQGGVIHATASNRENIHIKVVDFDYFEDPIPGVEIPKFEELEFETADHIATDKEILTLYKEQWEEAYTNAHG